MLRLSLAFLVVMPLIACANQIDAGNPGDDVGRPDDKEIPIDPPKDPPEDPPEDPPDDPPAPAVCGNGVADQGEDCDGSALGAGSCDRLGFDGGSLACGRNCTFDTTGCTTTDVVDPPPPSGAPTPIAAPGALVTLNGSLDLTDPSWTRPGEDCAASASPNRRYDLHRVVNNTGAPRTITINATFTGDGYLHAYTGTFDPAAPETGCVSGNDDGASTSDSELLAVGIGTGSVITIVVSSYGADAALGAYSFTVTTDDGAGPPPPPPPPPTAVCGDDIRSGAEACDGIAFGGDSCSAHGFNRGNLRCSATCAAIETAGCFTVVPPAAIAARGSSINLSGALAATDPKWSRPSETCTAGAAIADRNYDAFEIVNNTGSAQSLDLTATFGGDGFIHVFSTFDPANPTAGCVRGDDDFGGANGAQLLDVAIAAGQTLTVVASTYAANAAIGAFTVQVLTKQPVAAAVCGNGVREAAEVCDGASLGGASCLTRGHEGGSISCAANCTAIVETACWDLEPAVPIAAVGGSIAFGGDLTGQDPRIDRVSETCTGSGAADHPWDGFRIVNNGSAARTLTVNAMWAGGDGFLLAYRSSFNAQTPLTGCIKGDDDFGAGESQITDLAIAAGETLVIVASTFAGNANIGAYDIEVVTNGPPATPIAGQGLTLQLAGSLDAGDASYERPSESCTSSGATNRKLDAYRIQNTTGAAQRLTVHGNWAGDGYLHVFGAGFDAANPLASCRRGDDDFGTNASRITGVDIAAGETLVVVASSYAASAVLGAYTIDVLTEGTAAIAAVGGSVVTAGALHTSDSQWNRPSESCTDDGGTAGSFFDTHLIKNSGAVDRELDITASWGSGDGFLVVYFGTFDPTAGAGPQCIDGDDDFNGMTASQVLGLVIFPGETLTVVATTFGSSVAIPSYTLDVRTAY